MDAQQLADLIEKNPNCYFEIDNDAWTIYNEKEELIALSDNFNFDSNWYGNSQVYGAGIADALVLLLNKKGFNIKQSIV